MSHDSHDQESISTERGYKQSMDHNAQNLNAFILIYESDQICDGILANAQTEYGRDDTGQIKMPEHILNRVKRVAFYLMPDLEQAHNELTTVPTPQDSSESDQTRKKDIALHPALETLFELPPKDFFQDKKGLHLAMSPTGGQMKTMMQYHKDIDNRAKEDQARSIIMRLVFNSLVTQLPHRTRTEANTQAPHISEKTSNFLYNKMLEDAEDEGEDEAAKVPTQEEFLVWLREENKAADRYAYLADQLGRGALMYLIPYMSAGYIKHELVKTSPVCRRGIEHLWKIGLPESPGVLQLNGRVQDLQTFLARDVFAELGKIFREEGK